MTRPRTDQPKRPHPLMRLAFRGLLIVMTVLAAFLAVDGAFALAEGRLLEAMLALLPVLAVEALVRTALQAGL